MINVGLAVVTEPQANLGATFLFDTALPGNGNDGHTAGTNLPEEDKRALIEFLKGFGAGRRTPTTFNGALRKLPENAEATPKKADGRPAY
jgi:6-phosphogluconolactonase/glucosamine-6-phosphate isomerase/deaminase